MLPRLAKCNFLAVSQKTRILPFRRTIFNGNISTTNSFKSAGLLKFGHSNHSRPFLTTIYDATWRWTFTDYVIYGPILLCVAGGYVVSFVLLWLCTVGIICYVPYTFISSFIDEKKNHK